MTRVSFQITTADLRLVDQIVVRAVALCAVLKIADAPRAAGLREELDLTMDLIATHANGCPMDWSRLLDAKDFDFIHDVGGIVRHINRRSGKLGGCFFPRCAVRSSTLTRAFA